MERREPQLISGAVAGLAAGLFASLAMEQFQKLWAAASSSGKDGGDPATVKAAGEVSQTIAHRPLAKADKGVAGEAVHYGLGAALGIAYGIAAEYRPGLTAGFGSAFGAATALLLDDIAVPAFGLAEAPWKTPVGTHAYSLASHLVFGVVTEGTRSSLRKIA